MEYTLRYRSSRREVMRLYARLWRARLWKVHAMVLLGATLGIGTLLAADRPGALPWIAGAGAGLLCIASFAAWPLLAFKSQERLLVVDADGLRTTIGNKTGALVWREVRAIERAHDCVHVVRHDLNTFVVPRRAFATDAEVGDFVHRTGAWLAASR